MSVNPIRDKTVAIHIIIFSIAAVNCEAECPKQASHACIGCLQSIELVFLVTSCVLLYSAWRLRGEGKHAIPRDLVLIRVLTALSIAAFLVTHTFLQLDWTLSNNIWLHIHEVLMELA
eukprot:1521_1